MVGNRTVLAVGIAALAVLGAVAAVGLVGPDQPGVGESDDGNTSQSMGGDAVTGDSTVEVAAASQVDWVREDRSMRVSVALDAAEPVTRTVSLRVDEDGDGELDRTVAETRQRLSASDRTRVDFQVPAGDLPTGDHRYGVVAGEATRMLGTTTVVATPAFEIIDASAAAVTVAGTPTNVSLTVGNVGDYGATRAVTLGVDADGSGSIEPDETVSDTSVTLGSGETGRLSLTVPPGSLEPGNYTYRLAAETEAGDDRVTDNVTATGTLVVLEPAAFAVSADSVPVANVTRGTPATVAATVSNTGDVDGTTTAVLRGPAGEPVTESEVTLAGGAGTTASFEVATANLSRGTYEYTVTAGDDEVTVPVRVRDGVLDVSALRGNESIIVGDPMVFEATVTNTGDAPATGEARLRIDLDDDDRTEYDGLSTSVTLAPGNETTVRFDVPYTEDPDPLNQVEDLPTGSYIYGIYTEDDNETSVFDARQNPTSYDPFVGSAGSAGGGDTEDSEPLERASRDEISQSKYGLDYAELSGETKSQVEELYARQPFAGDLGVTDVLTREEIARQKYGLGVKRGDRFDFSGIETDLQQRIEADFDAQLTTDESDRIESWDELAQQRYGSDYGALSASQQETVREAYRDQFE